MVAWSLAAVAAVLAIGGSLLNLYGRIPLLASISTQGTALCLAVDGGATTGEVFEAYSELIPGPELRPGEVVMDNLSSHRGVRERQLIEERGCEALAKVKALLQRAAAGVMNLVETRGVALDAITAQDAHRLFGSSAFTNRSVRGRWSLFCSFRFPGDLARPNELRVCLLPLFCASGCSPARAGRGRAAY
jgi:hypothetical protein